jgi:hypothetical protein
MHDALAIVPRPEAAAQPETATTPQEYRAAHPGMHEFSLASATVTIELLEDPRRARYVFECQVETLGETPAKYWYYDVPAGRGEIRDLRAWDGGSTLQARVCAGEGGATRVEVRMREAIRRGERRTFTFGYECAIRAIVAVGERSRTVSYADWMIFNIPCDLLRVRVVLPSKSVLIATVPAAEVEDARQAAYEFRGLRPLETVSFLVAYRRRQLGMPFYKWLASSIGSGLIGALIARALGG